MESIGVRDLRQSASAVLRRVATGETFEVTSRGRLVALLVPAPAETGLSELYRLGLASPPTEDMDVLGPALRRAPGERAPSEVLAEFRADER